MLSSGFKLTIRVYRCGFLLVLHINCIYRFTPIIFYLRRNKEHTATTHQPRVCVCVSVCEERSFVEAKKKKRRKNKLKEANKYVVCMCMRALIFMEE